MPIIRSPSSPEHTPEDADALALKALGWVLTEDARAERLLALTGLTPDILRERLTDKIVLAAVLDFLANHEPDLILAADAINVEPQVLLDAREQLSR